MSHTIRSLFDAKTLLLPIFLSVLLIFASQVSFLLFHTLAEFFAIVVAILASVVAWQMYSFTRNHFLMYLGCGYFWIASLDMMHALTYKGLSILPVTGPDITVQLWVGTRYLEALLLLTAPWFLAHSLKRNFTLLLFGVISIILVTLIMSGGFPVTFIEGKGLTKFKIYSEYTIITIIALAIFYLSQQRRLTDQRIFILMIVSMVLTMMAELAFTFYVSLYGLSNLAGHTFKLFSFWFIFVAVVRTTLRDPFSAMSKAETYYDAVPDATIILNKEGIIEHVNQAACLLANKSSTELIGKSAHGVFHNKNTNSNNCTVCQTIAHCTELSSYEMPVSETSWFDFSTSLIKGENSFVEVIRDITDKKTMSNELEKNKARLTLTLDSIGDGVIVTDTEGCVTRMNPVAEQLTGWSFPEAKGLLLKTIFPIVEASTHKPIESPIQKVMRSGEAIHLSNHTTLIAKDGKEYQITDSAAPIRDENNNIIGMVLVFNDISEQYQLREVATKDRRDLQAILDNTPAVVYVKDIDGYFTFINQEFEKLFHTQRENILGKTLHDIFPKEIADEMRRNDIAVEESRIALRSEEVAPQDDGLHTYLSIKFPLFDEANNVYAVCGISTDITERKNIEDEIRLSEQHLKLYREQTPMATIEWNTDFQVVDWNHMAEKMFGYKLEEVKGRNFVDIMLPESAIVDVEQIWQELMSQTGGEVSVNKNLTKDGKIILCEWHNTPIRDESGKIIGAASIVQDITQYRQQEEQLRRSQKMDALGKLTGGVAHDYNNMLGVVLGYAELLKDELSDQPVLASYADEIRHAGQRGAKLTNKLLSFSRKQTSDAEMLNINTLLLDEKNMLEKTMTVRIKLEFDLTDNLWSVWLDSNDMEDAILNMSINAMHAMKDHGILTIGTSNKHLNKEDALMMQVNEGDYVLLSITDTGCGMDEITKEKIFEPFYSTKGDEGTGLGLSQVYGFMTRSNGTIKVYSEQDHGTRFSLYFPRYEESLSQGEETTARDTVDLSGKETILVVDDEPILLKLTSKLLVKQGYSVFSAQRAKEALEILENESIDLLLSDIIMPDMDGYELAAIVQEKYPDIKIQLASGFNDERNIEKVDEKLTKNLLNKPYSVQNLYQRIRTLLD